MSPLLFLAIAIVVPLLGMIVLGVGARIKRQKATDDETGLFRRKLESIAPLEAEEPPSGTPGLVGTMRRRNRGSFRKETTSSAALIPAPKPPAQEPPAPAPASIRLVERDYSVPPLPPRRADLEELPLPPGERRSRRAMPRPPEAERRHDRVISSNRRPMHGPNQRPNQRRTPGS